jgi:SAM-dependent methyltransferase
MIENHMGLNALWLTEALCQVMDVRPEMRVLDLGCGRAISSIFLAKEFGCKVWATDLGVDRSNNLKRIRDAGVEDLVFPLQEDAKKLPFDEGFFDLTISVNAFQYFGIAKDYLNHLSNVMRNDGQIGIIVPGFTHELIDEIPPTHLGPYWSEGYWDFHCPNWWRNHWEESRIVSVELADMIPNGCQLFQKWLEVCLEQGSYPDCQVPEIEELVEKLRIDAGRYLGYTRIVGRKWKPNEPISKMLVEIAEGEGRGLGT